MPKVSRSFFDDEDLPDLVFEDPAAPAPKQRTVGNHAAAPPMSAYGVPQHDELMRKEEEMVKIQHELEKTRRQAEKMREIREKNDRFHEGRRLICEKIARCLPKLDRELHSAHKAIEEIAAAQEIYQRHIEALRSIHAGPNGLPDDHLDEAIGAVEDAESEFTKRNQRLAAVLPHIEADGDQSDDALPRTFSEWVQAGFAFTLPLILAAAVFALLMKLLP
ncbi:MAG: hypothetical protein ACOYMN_01280 [Roseimicrobium sp.]